MKIKTRYGKNEKAILKILKEYEYVEYSIRALASKIKGIERLNSQYNSIRNAVDRLEEYDIVETIPVPVFGGNFMYFPKGIATHVRMVRLKDPSGREWDCKDGVYFSGIYTLKSQFSNCRV